MRVMLYEAAQSMLRSKKWSWLKARAMQIARRRGMKKAIVALARRLAVILHRLIEEPLDQNSGAVETPFSVQREPRPCRARWSLTAILLLVDISALLHLWRLSRLDFFAAVIARVAGNIGRHCEIDQEVHAKE